VTTVVNAPRTVIAGINAILVDTAHNVAQPYPSATGTVGVANEPTAVSSCMVSSSSNNNNNNNNNSCITAILNDNLGTLVSADVWATRHLGIEDWATWVGLLGDKC